MKLLDTDTLSLLIQKHAKVVARFDSEPDTSITVISYIEMIRGRFDAVIKAEDGEKILKAQFRLEATIVRLDSMRSIPLKQSSAALFDKLLLDKKLRKIGRGDILIACIALAANATLITRNVRDFKLVPHLRIENWAD